MIDDERALLAAVAASPADDAPRLVYADWLDEYGRPVRAEFVRIQIEIARLADAPQVVRNARVGLWKREREILDGHADELLGPLATVVGPHDAEFRRGFLYELTGLPVERFLEHAEHLAGLTPPVRVGVKEVAARLDAFLGSPHLGCVARVSAYAESTDLGFVNAADPDRLTAAVARLGRLETLDLEGCGLGDATAAFVGTLPFPALADLDLSNNGITDAGVIDLLGTPLPARLRRVVLGGNPIGDQGAIELADRWPRNGRLENLNLRFTNIGQPGWRALTARFGGVVDLF
jgi:uncharacterized protein (TIGR02996 family)